MLIYEIYVLLKISRQINVLSRITRFLTLEGRKAIYYSFVMSNFSFCPLIWHFCSKGNTSKLEKLHYRALKFVYQDFYSGYEILLSNNHHCLLTIHRLRQLALETFKIVNGTSPSFLQELLKEAIKLWVLETICTDITCTLGQRPLNTAQTALVFLLPPLGIVYRII